MKKYLGLTTTMINSFKRITLQLELDYELIAIMVESPKINTQSSKLSGSPMTEASKIGIGLPKIIDTHVRWASTLFSAAIMILIKIYGRGYSGKKID